MKTPPRLHAIAALEKAGFTVLHEFMREPLITGIHATTAPEPFNVSPHHFTPAKRHIFVGKAKGGYYATSSIHGIMRRYRCRRSDAVRVGNVFGKGRTELAAVRDFLAKFTATPKRYNVRP